MRERGREREREGRGERGRKRGERERGERGKRDSESDRGEGEIERRGEREEIVRARVRGRERERGGERGRREVISQERIGRRETTDTVAHTVDSDWLRLARPHTYIDTSLLRDDCLMPSLSRIFLSADILL